MYKDMAIKAAFHKERIINSFIDLGVYPTDSRIKEIIESIDMSLPFLYTKEAIPGEAFDTQAHNAMMLSIYRDLELLYKLLFEFSVSEYTLLTSFIDTHLDSLEQTISFYKEKAEQEIGVTSLGKTLLFKNNSFNIKIQNDTTRIDLGKVNVHKGSRIASIINASDIEGDKIVFSYINGDEIIRATPYNFNNHSIVIPGEIKKTEHVYNISKDQVIDGMIKMDIGKKPNSNNKYIILAAKDKVLVKQFGEITKHMVQSRPTKFDMLAFNEKSYIDFYTIGTNSITFRFNKKPVSTNFSLDNYVVNNLNYIHHFFIECDSGFSFDFDIDGGQVFALKEEGVIANDELFFAKTIEIREFNIIEYELGDEVTYNVAVDIINDDGNPIDIQHIMIKELLAMEDTHNDSV